MLIALLMIQRRQNIIPHLEKQKVKRKSFRVLQYYVEDR